MWQSFWSCKKRAAVNECLVYSEIQIEIKQEVVEQLQAYAQHEGNELCGVLMGSQIADNKYRINKVSPPCVKSNSRYSCERDAEQANAYIEKDFEQSNHTRVYIGEWHTHLQQRPQPSGTDYNAILTNYTSSRLCVQFLIMVVVGTDSIYYSVYDGKGFVEITPLVV